MQNAPSSDGPEGSRAELPSSSFAGLGEGRRSAFGRNLRGALLFTLLIVAAYADPLLLRRNFGGRDLLGYSLPIEKAIHDAYSRGKLPLWLSDISGGRPLLANPNGGALYPVRPLLSLFPYPLAIRIFPVFHWALAGIGMMVLASSLGLGPSACWVASVTYALSGVSISEVFYPNIHPGMALLPWLLWALHRPTRWGVKAVAMGLVLGLLFLAGDIFVCALALLCALLWIALETPPAFQKSSLAALGVALVLAALLAAPQIVATALWIPVTNRAILGMRLREALLFSVSPFRLLEYVIPYPFGPTWQLGGPPAWGWRLFQEKSVGLFTGFYAGAFVLFAVLIARRSRASGARFARALLVLTIVVSVVPSFVPAGWGTLPSPLPLRYPEKLAVGTLLGLSLLAGVAFESFRRDRHRLRWALWIGAVLTAAAVAARAFPEEAGHLAVRAVGAEPEAAARAAHDLPAAISEAGLLWIASLVALELVRRGSRFALGCGVALLTFVPLAANRRIATTFRQEELLAPSPLDRFANRIDPSGRYRTLGESSYRPASALQNSNRRGDPGGLDSAVRRWDQYSHVLWGRGTVFNMDFDHGDLSRLESLRGIASMASSYLDSAPFFGALGLRWGIRFRDQQSLGGYRPIRNVGWQVWDEHERAFPAVRLLENWVEAPSLLAAASSVPRLKDGEIVLETEVARRGFARPGRLWIRENTPEKLLLDTEVPDATWLFVLRGFWAYRDVRVDGRPVETVPATIAFTAVPIPRGSHHIEWTEELPGWRFSVWCPLLSVALAFVVIRVRREPL